MRLDQFNLVVSDVSAARAFYTRLGLTFENVDDDLWRHHHVGSRTPGNGAGIDLDLDSVAFAPKWNAGWAGGSGVVIGFKVDSRQAVDDLVAELTGDGVTMQQPPFDAFWGARYAVVSDPDGNAVGIMSPIDDAMKSPPPDPR